MQTPHLNGIGIACQMEDGRPTGAALRFEGAAQQRRGRADAWSKIAFQYFARREPLIFQELGLAVSRGAMDVVQTSQGIDCNVGPS